MKTLYHHIFDSPCGPISIVFNENNTLLHLDFPDQGERQAQLLAKRFVTYQLVEQQTPICNIILRYLEGDMKALSTIPCETGGTDFQQTVWRALQTIPPGQTVSYKELAETIGKPTASRAVARANALNPISLIYPCHRVIGSDGSLTGYAGGLERKAWLLKHEGALETANAMR